MVFFLLMRIIWRIVILEVLLVFKNLFKKLRIGDFIEKFYSFKLKNIVIRFFGKINKKI